MDAASPAPPVKRLGLGSNKERDKELTYIALKNLVAEEIRRYKALGLEWNNVDWPRFLRNTPRRVLSAPEWPGVMLDAAVFGRNTARAQSLIDAGTVVSPTAVRYAMSYICDRELTTMILKSTSAVAFEWAMMYVLPTLNPDALDIAIDLGWSPASWTYNNLHGWYTSLDSNQFPFEQYMMRRCLTTLRSVDCYDPSSKFYGFQSGFPRRSETPELSPSDNDHIASIIVPLYDRLKAAWATAWATAKVEAMTSHTKEDLNMSFINDFDEDIWRVFHELLATKKRGIDVRKHALTTELVEMFYMCERWDFCQIFRMYDLAKYPEHLITRFVCSDSGVHLSDKLHLLDAIDFTDNATGAVERLHSVMQYRDTCSATSESYWMSHRTFCNELLTRGLKYPVDKLVYWKGNISHMSPPTIPLRYSPEGEYRTHPGPYTTDSLFGWQQKWQAVDQIFKTMQ